MELPQKTQVLWSPEQRKEIEKACSHAISMLNSWGAMHLITLLRVLENCGYTKTLTNSKGKEASLAGLITWHLLDSKQVKAVSGKTLKLTGKEHSVELDGVAEIQVLETVKDLGGIATQENIEHSLLLEGYGMRSIREAVESLLKKRVLRAPFILSPDRRVWTPR